MICPTCGDEIRTTVCTHPRLVTVQAQSAQDADILAALVALKGRAEAAEDGMRQFVERAAKERTRAEAAEAKLAEADHRFDPMSDRVIVTGEGWRALKAQAARAAAAEAKLAAAERELEKAQEWIREEGGAVTQLHFAKARAAALEKALRAAMECHADWREQARAVLAGKEGP